MSAAQRQQAQQNQADPDAEAVAPEQSEQMERVEQMEQSERVQQMDSAPVGSPPAEPAAAPLTSLDSLFGGALDGASTCAVDGTCD